VKGVGTFDNVNFTGTFSPGLSPAILSVGNIALSSTSTLVMELGGSAAGSGDTTKFNLPARYFSMARCGCR
jgi:hypothetical protein